MKFVILLLFVVRVMLLKYKIFYVWVFFVCVFMKICLLLWYFDEKLIVLWFKLFCVVKKECFLLNKFVERILYWYLFIYIVELLNRL